MQCLAVLKLRPGITSEQLGPQVKPEAASAWAMLAAGVVRSLHYIAGEHGPAGAVLLLEVADAAEAQAQVERLPLVAHGLVDVEILPLAPFTAFAALFAA